MREKLIIDNQSDLPMFEAVLRVLQVVEKGRISDDGKSYCLLSAFADGVKVVALRNKKSDRLVVM